LGKLIEKNTDTSSHHTTLPLAISQDILFSSPTPIHPSFAATPSTSASEGKSGITPTTKTLSEDQVQEQELDDDDDAVDNKIVANLINTGEQVHIVWFDTTSGNSGVLYKRDGSDFDPTTENLINAGGGPAVAVSGNNVHIVWTEFISGSLEILYTRSINWWCFIWPHN
jgi:hypothetical protein